MQQRRVIRDRGQQFRDLCDRVDGLLADGRADDAHRAVWTTHSSFRHDVALHAGWLVLSAQTWLALGSVVSARSFAARVDEGVLDPADRQRLERVREAIAAWPGSAAAGHRFRPDPVPMWGFKYRVLVSCPRCGACGVVSYHGPAPFEEPFTCAACALVAGWGGVNLGREPGAGLPDRLDLFLTVRTRHGWLWALNEEHLAQLGALVDARLRERTPVLSGNGSWASRLPSWVTSAKNRDEMHRAVTRLKAKLV